MTAPELVEVGADGWDDLLARLGVVDVYYSRGFVAASAPLAGGEPVLLHLADGAVFAALVRRDPPDVVTPYGYGGPLAVGERAAEWPAAYERWCGERGVVSTFAVLHPLLETVADGFRVSSLAGTVAWDLGTDDLEAGMHRHHRRLVRRARSAGFEVSVHAPSGDLGAFPALYEATMRRADAADFYFFSDDYWQALRRDVRLVRVDVRDGAGEVVAGVLGMGAPPLLHYHLGAAADAARGTGASHMALLALAGWGRANGYGLLHLGGGVGGRADSLLEYKLRFAPDGLLPARVGKAVHDPEAYARLAGVVEIDWDGFFPAYRAAR